MARKISRRKFIGTGITTLGGVVVCHFSIFSAAEEATAIGSSSDGTKEVTMPHVIVKLWPGRSEQQKVALAEAIVRDVVDIIGSGEDSISVGIEDIDANDWEEKVYKPDIRDKSEALYKKPGYSM